MKTYLQLIKLALHAYLRNRYTSKKLQDYCKKKLVETIKNAYKDVPFYQQHFDKANIDISTINTFKDFKQLPFLEKNDVRQHFSTGKLLSSHYDIEQCIESKTTGSSGNPLRFSFSSETFSHYMILHLRSFFIIGYRPWHKLVYIKGGQVETPKIGPLFPMKHLQNTLAVEEKIIALIHEKPDLLIGYTSNILEIANNINHQQLKQISLKFIFVNSEQSTVEERNHIEKIFNCPVYDEYSCEEMWMIASQCKLQQYHVFTDNVWLEYLDEQGQEVADGELGEIVITSLQSPAMPFIRYRIGDYGRKSTTSCSCGSSFPVIAEFEGRIADAFTMNDGRKITQAKLISVLNETLPIESETIREFKLVQHNYDELQILIAPGGNFDDSFLPTLHQRLEALCQSKLSLSLKLKQSIDPTTVKRKVVESLI